MPTGEVGRLRASALAAAVFTAGIILLAVPLFFFAMMLAGPHSDLLPGFLQPAVLVACWIALIVVPAWIASRVYRSRVRSTRR